ncbi:MAG: MBL fold metallo-hydrolase, partial [Lachnospiraceae bacterium]|nr:MBL fold metallo-hydrolase [Candidatus Equihabitans merdae]
DAVAPYSGTVYDLTANEVVTEGVPKAVEERVKKPLAPGAKTANALVLRLLNAANRLMNIVKRSEGRPNKDLTRMARDIEAFCEKYE